MLVLKRRRGEAIVLDGGIRIVLLESDRRGARIGIEAPPDTSIKREELLDPDSRPAGEERGAARTGSKRGRRVRRVRHRAPLG